MLIEAPYKINDVVSLKLTTGEEIVCKLLEDNADNIKIKTPLVLVAGPQGIGMQQFMFTTDPDQPVTMKKASINVIQKTEKQFSNVYTEKTSGLVTAPPNLQVT